MTTPDLCSANKELGIKVRNFIMNVPSAKEESITDYLVWKWRELDAKFNYINVKTFTRQQENTKTGADFELELWLVGRTQCLPLLFQAKKFTQPFAGYVGKLNYPRNTQAQLTKLIAYANTKRLLPFYSIYTRAQASSSLCGGGEALDTGIYMIDAHEIKKFADRAHYGSKVSLAALLSRSNPFHCMFCCPMGTKVSYFQKYFRSQAGTSLTREINAIPGYVRQLLFIGEQRDENTSVSRESSSYDYPPVRTVGVYDLRHLE